MEEENRKQKDLINYLLLKNQKIQKRKNEYKIKAKDMEVKLEKAINQKEDLLNENTKVWK